MSEVPLPPDPPPQKPNWAQDSRARKEHKNWDDEDALRGVKTKNDILWHKCYGWIVVFIMFLLVAIFTASLVVWVWHQITPYLFLTAEQLSKIQSVIFSGTLGAIVSTYMQKQLAK